jgi:hypothetical protein
MRVDRLVKLGARVIDVRQDDPETHDNPDTWTVLDPVGMDISGGFRADQSMYD